MPTFITRKRRMDGLGAWKTLAAFGIPAALMFLGVHGVMRWFNNVSGLAPFYGYFLALSPPLALMLAAAILAGSREGSSPAWPSLKERLRLRSMDRGTWLWTVGVLIAAFLLTGVMTALVVGLPRFQMVGPADHSAGDAADQLAGAAHAEHDTGHATLSGAGFKFSSLRPLEQAVQLVPR